MFRLAEPSDVLPWRSIRNSPRQQLKSLLTPFSWLLASVSLFSRPFAVENLPRNFLGGFFHSFLDFLLFWFNVHSFAAW